MTATVLQVPRAGRPHVVQGWVLGGEGRKVHTGSAVYDEAGDVLAVAESTWITLT